MSRVLFYFINLLALTGCLSLDRLQRHGENLGQTSHFGERHSSVKDKFVGTANETTAGNDTVSSTWQEELNEEDEEEEEFVDLPTPGPSPWGKKTVRLPPQAIDWPVDEARLTRGYFLKHPTRKKGRPHLGLDLANKKGTAIFSSHDGVVIYAGRGFRGYGRMIMVEANNGEYATLYAHLSKIRVRQGYQVKQGDWIGDMGSTGRSTGPHLHFEIRTLAGPVDPLLYLPPVRAERLGHQWGVGRQMIAWGKDKTKKQANDSESGAGTSETTSASAE